MIANPEVADIFRNRAKVSHLPFPSSQKVTKDLMELSSYHFLF